MNSILIPILFYAVIVLTCGIAAHFLTNLVRKKTSNQVVVNIAFVIFIFFFLFLFYKWASRPIKCLRHSDLQKPIPVTDQEKIRTYYPDGQVKEEYSMKDGKIEGPYKFYYKNGKLFTEGIFKDGKLEGPVKEYDQNGKLFGEGVFENGKPTSETPERF